MKGLELFLDSGLSDFSESASGLRELWFGALRVYGA